MLMTDFKSEEEPDEELVHEHTHHEYINLVDGLYTQLKFHKEHFSTMQNKCRALSSTWFLASIAGIGYLLAQHSEIEITFNIFLAIMILSFSAGLGTTLLWYVDIMLYKKLWLANVVALAKLEREYHWLPRANLNILIMLRSRIYRFSQGTTYIGINALLVAIISISAIFYFTPVEMYKILIIVVLAAAIIYGMVHQMLKLGFDLEKATMDDYKK